MHAVTSRTVGSGNIDLLVKDTIVVDNKCTKAESLDSAE